MIKVQTTKKTLEKHLEKKEYLKILQLVGNQYDSTEELFFVVEAYLGLGRYDIAEKMLISWQNKLSNPDEWANWCYLYGKSLFGMRNKKDALTTLQFAVDFLKNAQNNEIKEKIEKLKIKINENNI